MKFDEYPKAFKKIIRYINQEEVSTEQLEHMQKFFIY
jgi:hypothetical protein